MEHNTLVKYGFIQADILSVPDPEGETAKNFPQGKPHYICNDDDDNNPIPKKVTKKHSLDSPNPVKSEIYPATQHNPNTQKKVVKKHALIAQTIPKKRINHPFKLMYRSQLLYLYNLAQVLFGAITAVDMMLYL